MASVGSNQITGGHCQHESSAQHKVFTNSLIVSKISKMMSSMEDLKSFRLINTTTHHESLPVFKRKAFVPLTYGYGGSGANPFAEEIEQVDKFQNFKSQRCALPPRYKRNDYGLTSAELPFWKRCGPHIKHLILKQCKCSQKGLVDLICNLAPNLESLTVESALEAYDVLHSYAGRVPSWKIQPNLRVLHVSGHGKDQLGDWTSLKFLPNLEEIRVSDAYDDDLILTIGYLRKEENCPFPNLRNVDVIETHQMWLLNLDQVLPSLQNLSLNLETFESEATLQGYFACQCDSLQTLKLFRFPLANRSPLSSFTLKTNFSSLKELYLWGKVVSSLDFLMWTPALKKLVVDLQCYDRRFDISNSETLKECRVIEAFTGDMVQNSKALLESIDFEHWGLEHFEIDHRFDGNSLQVLGKWMPNLQVLKTILSDQTLAVVCNQWRDLKELKLMFDSNVTDRGITGMRNGQPNVKDLKELTHFSLEWCYGLMSTITDASAYNAFLEMPKLQHLQIYVSPQMSPEAEALLKKKIRFVQIMRNYDQQHSRI